MGVTDCPGNNEIPRTGAGIGLHNISKDPVVNIIISLKSKGCSIFNGFRFFQLFP